jgi:hypothetical protein
MYTVFVLEGFSELLMEKKTEIIACLGTNARPKNLVGKNQ